MKPNFITVHNSYNDASAENEIAYMQRNDSATSFHVAVDDVNVIQAIPFHRNAWHCGDGNGKGNRESIGVEIAYSKSGGERYVKAEENAVQYIALLLKQFGWGIDRVKKHQDWSGKYCPHRILDNKAWGSFLDRVQKALDVLNKGGNEVSKEELAKLQDRMDKLEEAMKNKADSIVNKTDAHPNHADNWKWAKDNGITDGSNPQGALSRQHFATMLKRFYDKFIKNR
jgi:N-acetylmuramoyl-L-alanine amidase